MSEKYDLLEFPCEFTIKVFGETSVEFDGVVFEIMRKHAPDIGESAIQTRPSKNNKYNALSVTINAQSKEQIDNIYRDLSSHPLVVMAL